MYCKKRGRGGKLTADTGEKTISTVLKYSRLNIIHLYWLAWPYKASFFFSHSLNIWNFCPFSHGTNWRLYIITSLNGIFTRTGQIMNCYSKKKKRAPGASHLNQCIWCHFPLAPTTSGGSHAPSNLRGVLTHKGWSWPCSAEIQPMALKIMMKCVFPLYLLPLTFHPL